MLAGLTERQEELYAAFYNSTKDNQHLNHREALLVGLAAAMAVNCIPCQRFYLLECRKAGIPLAGTASAPTAVAIRNAVIEALA